MSSEGLAELLPLLDERGPACSTGDFTKISNPYETVFRLCFTMCAGVAAVSAGLKATGFKTKVVEGSLMILSKTISLIVQHFFICYH